MEPTSSDFITPPVDLVAYMMPRRMAAAARRRFAAEFAQLAAKRWCLHCHAEFTLHDSLATLDCASHPGRFKRGVWECCGQAPAACGRHGIADGCAPCDHVFYRGAHALTAESAASLPLPVFLALPWRHTRHVAGVALAAGAADRLEDDALRAVRRPSAADVSPEDHAIRGNRAFTPPAFAGTGAGARDDGALFMCAGRPLDAYRVVLRRLTLAPTDAFLRRAAPPALLDPHHHELLTGDA